MGVLRYVHYVLRCICNVMQCCTVVCVYMVTPQGGARVQAIKADLPYVSQLKLALTVRLMCQKPVQ